MQRDARLVYSYTENDVIYVGTNQARRPSLNALPFVSGPLASLLLRITAVQTNMVAGMVHC